LNAENAKGGVKVTMLAFLVKACVAALKKFPEFNSSLDGENLILKQYYHIGFAADTPNGLMVPVIKDADQKGIFQIAKETSDLAAKARDGKLGPGDMQGGTFSISSLGGIGISRRSSMRRRCRSSACAARPSGRFGTTARARSNHG
jgi:pyruvate dehydrogenase E2 component (dihydrolipoamide acetyltransferase)